MEKLFIYVFSVEDKEALLDSGFYLLGRNTDNIQDEKHPVFVFANEKDRSIPLDSGKYKLSNTLWFGIGQKETSP